MANVMYPLFAQSLLDMDAGVDVDDGDLRAILVDTGLYTYSAAHDHLDDVPAGARVATSPTITNTTVAAGVLDGDDTTFAGTGGSSAEALILYLHTGVEGTSKLVAYMDQGVSGLPYQPPAGAWSVNVVWDNGANKIFKLG